MHLKLLVCGIFLLAFFRGSAQTDTGNVALREIIITGFHSSSPNTTSLNIEPYSLDEIERRQPFNLSDALSKLPGISQITTSNAISKPVIRGLYGNRILVLLSGLRFDNQQWQDEHGLGLPQIGIEKMEIIRGPASIIYGTDALGGVINVIEEKPTAARPYSVDGTIRLHSNTLGTLSDFGIQRYRNRRWWRLRLGLENHADYSDGNGARVLNSRNNGYYFKAGYGIDKTRWKQDNSYHFSFSQFGFILEDLSSFFTADGRYSRAMEGPHHNVILNVLNSQNTFLLSKSTLKVNAGVQSNVRMEDEGGGQISLNMHLFSALENARWEKELSRHTLLVLNQQLTFENNTNYGGRIIIPDANMLETNVSGFLRRRFQRWVVEAGLGGNHKFIETFVTRTLNSPGQKIQPFATHRSTANGLLGVVYHPVSGLTFKANGSSGFRAANLAELSSNGLHEGVFRYEIGDPGLKVEQNINGDLSLEYQTRQVFLSGSVYYNQFFNYIYLAPTDEQFFGFQVFRYRQQDAHLRGYEATAQYQPDAIRGLRWKETFYLTKGSLSDGGNLPFIPAPRLTSAIFWEKKYDKTRASLFVEPEWVRCFEQNAPGQFETPTAGYNLINLHTGWTKKLNSHRSMEINLTAANIFNTVYADHLSRLKYYGLYNQGRNFILSVKMKS